MGVGAKGEDQQQPDAVQRLWSPWRMAYIRDPRRQATGCVFCDKPGRGAEHDRDSLILYRGELIYVILNAYPYNPGHLMVVPFRHVAGFEELSADELGELGRLSQRAVRALRRSSHPEAFNLGINVGALAGAGIADHIHQHVVPRWAGDTNFMPVIGHTRVLPELLEETYDRLRPVFAES
ncbi:MAG TPA: HIT domain-containing protein [Egibacteraceae bacterium]|nr:HIT domain-containing protein [Egibacteraceae bacterium]